MYGGKSERHFRVVQLDGKKVELGGVSITSKASPGSAARKLLTSIAHEKGLKKNKKASMPKVKFCIQEYTQGSSKKVYGPYVGHFHKYTASELKKAATAKGKVKFTMKPVVKLAKRKNNMKGGVGESIDLLNNLGKTMNLIPYTNKTNANQCGVVVGFTYDNKVIILRNEFANNYQHNPSSPVFTEAGRIGCLSTSPIQLYNGETWINYCYHEGRVKNSLEKNKNIKPMYHMTRKNEALIGIGDVFKKQMNGKYKLIKKFNAEENKRVASYGEDSDFWYTYNKLKNYGPPKKETDFFVVGKPKDGNTPYVIFFNLKENITGLSTISRIQKNDLCTLNSMAFYLLEKGTDNLVKYCQSNDSFENTSKALISSYSPGQDYEIFDIFINKGTKDQQGNLEYDKIPYQKSGGKRKLKSRK